MAHRIAVIPGDGIGPEIVDATIRVLEATGVAFDWDYREAGLDAAEKYDPAIQKIGELTDAAGMGHIREDAGLSLKIISERGTTRVARFAFEYARKYGRKKVTVVAKDNILKFTDGLFFATARHVAEGYSDIDYQEVLVDNMAMQLVQKPENYDVLLLPNLYGDVLSDLCAGLVGGLGVAPGANLGDEIALFEPVHGSAPKYAGQNKVNPMALLLPGVKMLRHITETQAAECVEVALAAVIAEGKSVTYDMKPSPDDPTAVGTSEVAEAVIEKLLGDKKAVAHQDLAFDQDGAEG